MKAEKLEKLAKNLDFRILLLTQHATHPLMVVIICGKHGNNRSRTENVTERTRFSKSRSNDLEDMGQGQRSSHATHLLMLVIICTKYGKNLSRTVDATERTRFSRPRPNDLEDIGQGQRSLHATHPLILVIICAKYGKNPSRTVDVTERTRQAGQTDGRTDRRTEWNQYTPQQLRCLGGIIINYFTLILQIVNFSNDDNISKCALLNSNYQVI